jgi:hypothetical protein
VFLIHARGRVDVSVHLFVANDEKIQFYELGRN